VVLSKRERYIAIGTVSVVAILIIDRVLFAPYDARRKAVEMQTLASVAELSKAQEIFRKQDKLRPEWAAIVKGGLKNDASQAESQLQHEVLQAAQVAEVKVASMKPERTTTDKNFQVMNYSVTGTGTMAGVARMLYMLERTKIPVRLTEIHTSPRRENTDDLSVRLSVSTIRLLPEEKPKTDSRGGR
jgi:hypothetical protein